MPAVIIYPTDGRGAWNSAGVGGTLNSSGDGPGRFFRAAASGALVEPIGYAGQQADRDWGECTIDEYAVWRATLAVQTELKDRGLFSSTVDGIWGTQTDTAVRNFQRQAGLTADGVYGPATAKTLWKPKVVDAIKAVDPDRAELVTIFLGTISLESSWDAAAVGADTNDLGLAQLNARAHPTMSINDRLNPKLALPYAARFVHNNLKAMSYNTRDAVAAYNLGVTGAKNWVAAGRPDIWKDGRNVKAYIDRILSLGASA